jgi:transposase
MTKLDREEVIGLYETGMLQKEVAKKLGVSVKTLSNFMKENDIETRKPTNYKKVSNEEKITIINSVNAGYASMAIEKKRTIKNEDKNLYIPEKWNWRSYA